MELKLSRGRYVTSDEGVLAHVSGQEETIQRILCRLSARRGGFYPMPDFGSRLYTLCGMKSPERAVAARQFVHEALEGEDVEILSVDCEDAPEDKCIVSVELKLGGSEANLTLTL